MNIFCKLKALLPWQRVGDGIYASGVGALQVRDSSASLVLAAGVEHGVALTTIAEHGLRLTRTASVGGRTIEHVQDFTLSRADDARAAFRDATSELRALLNGPRASKGRLRWILLGAVLFYFGASLLAGQVLSSAGLAQSAATAGLSPTAQSPQPVLGAGGQPVDPAAAAAEIFALLQQQGLHAPGGVPAVPAAAGGAPTAAGSAVQAKLTKEELAALAKISFIDVVPGKTVLSALSDPLCPACRALEGQAARMTGGHGFRVYPVAYQRGSREIVAAVLCSSDPREAWIEAMNGRRPAGPACEAGLKKVDANNDFFAAIGGSATPTVIAPNGAISSNGASSETLSIWVGLNAQ